MNYLNIIKSTILLGLLFAAPVREAAPAQPKPNILFIYVEDLGYYTSERFAREPGTRITGLKTPNLDKLAAESVVFTRAFVTDPTHAEALAQMRAEMKHWRESTTDRDIHPREIKRRTVKTTP